ncbi:MAG: hypothetical protein PVH59_03055 [Anaerolineae bacterium]|jgi:uncharacterized delta-60 repeat protein
MFSKRDVSVKGVFRAWFAVVLVLGVFLVALSLSGLPIRTGDVSYALGAQPADEEPFDVFVYLPMVARNFPFTPTAPTLYTISNPGGLGDYSVSWSASSGATTYTLQEDDNADFTSPATAYAGAATSTDISGRFPGMYYYRVRASNAAADSDWSNVEATQVTASSGCPATGSWGGTTSQGGQSGIGFDVTDVPYCRIPESELLGPFGIVLRITDSCGEERNIVNSSEIPIDNGLFDFTFANEPGYIRGQFTSQTTASGTFYANKDGCSASGTWTAELLPPGPFGKVGPADGATERPSSLTLSWEESARAESYEYCYDTTDDDACADWVNTGTTLEAEISGLLPSTTYYWQVRAVHLIGGITYADGGSTAYWSFTTGRIPGDFGKVNPADGATGVTDLSLEWGASPGAAYYEYCYDTTDDDACAAWTSTGVGTQATISGLEADTTYYWQVRAVNSFGTTYADGGSGEYWSFTTGDVPGAFAKTSPADGTNGLSSSVNLEWGDSLGAASYEYCYAVTSDCTDWISTGVMTQVTVNGLDEDTTYYWQARAVNQFGTTYADDDSAARWSFTVGQWEGTDAPVEALAIQSDDKILVGGWFTQLRGQPRNYIGRLNASGSLDVDFDPGADDWVIALAVQSDGKILVGGDFTALGGETRHHIGRLNPDGSLDTALTLGADGPVYTLAIQSDDKILVGGHFTELGGQPRSNIGRLNADGSLDTTFNPGADARVEALAIQPDGKILVGGSFLELAGQARGNIGRLNADGSLDTTFNTGTGGNYDEVDALAIQADGKIVVGGLFSELGGQPRSNIGRLNADGTLDLDFDPGTSMWVQSLVVQPDDNKILVGGMFGTLGGETRKYIGRLHPDGSLDAAFNPGANDYVLAMELQADGEIVVGGLFTELAGEPIYCIGRLYPDGTFID